MPRMHSLLVALSVTLVAPCALAQAAPKDKPTKERDGGSVVLGAKVGGLFSFAGLNPNVRAAVDAGYVLPFAKRSFAAVLEVGYTAPKSEGSQPDPRVPGGSYNWHLTEQQLTFMPTFLYRLELGAKIWAHAGIGPRLYFLQSNVKGDVNGVEIKETTERSSKLGFGVPIGAHYMIGPGALTAELLVEYGPLDHTATGDSNAGATSLQAGYLLML